MPALRQNAIGGVGIAELLKNLLVGHADDDLEAVELAAELGRPLFEHLGVRYRRRRGLRHQHELGRRTHVSLSLSVGGVCRHGSSVTVEEEPGRIDRDVGRQGDGLRSRRGGSVGGGVEQR